MPEPRGNADTAPTTSRIRSSVISHRRGKGGWRRGTGPYSARVLNFTTSHDALAAVHARIASAATRAGRNPADVALVAVSKTHDAAAIRPLIEAGQRVFGENRVQEAAAKWPVLRGETPGIALHLVGQLQSNKAEDAVALFDAIHSVDRPSLVAALGKAIDKSGRRPACFIQVDLADEPQKGGCAVADLPALLALAQTATLPVAGLMCVPPVGLEPAPWFALLAKLAADHGLTGLSMGMSGDYPTAVTLGATHVRVGSALFGDRE
jgi:PLP dependent protein